jgi:hypothetical protein
MVEGINLQQLGVVALDQANLPLAESYFQQALDIRQELDLTYYLVVFSLS